MAILEHEGTTRELVISANTSAFLVTYLVRLPTTGLLARLAEFTPMSSAFART
jgi:hypothetical protein